MTKQQQNHASDIISMIADYVEGHADKTEGAIYGEEQSSPRNPLDFPIEPGSSRPNIPVHLPNLARLFWGILGVYYYYKRQVKQHQTIAPSSLFDELEQFAVEKGASAIGYARITPDLIFKDKCIPHQNAIVIVSQMHSQKFANVPDDDSIGEVVRLYANTTIIASQITGFLRKRGYSAYAGISVGGSVDLVRLAENAGLGAIGYHGSLISPQDGALLRINVVYTGIENLPFPEVNEHLWVRDFCDLCRKCIRKCPAEAIISDPQPDEQGRISAVDVPKCGSYMANNNGCGVCIAICPFSIAGYEKVQKGYERRLNKRNAIATDA